ncbi:hypothetical protein HJG60_011574 [Phyllostomus discolor]|uniref:Uncharacterized protein n=1 Tax=Phyllostomus discolor TaxID=89673 RepID=A0A833ZNU2_9CHIR|nr:hypothetical protein HJG60_011574 [Phyllostomus discolor]
MALLLMLSPWSCGRLLTRTENMIDGISNASQLLMPETAPRVRGPTVYAYYTSHDLQYNGNGNRSGERRHAYLVPNLGRKHSVFTISVSPIFVLIFIMSFLLLALGVVYFFYVLQAEAQILTTSG